MNAFEEWKGTLRNPGIDMFIFTRHSTRALRAILLQIDLILAQFYKHVVGVHKLLEDNTKNIHQAIVILVLLF